jgi:hypothetical protein
MLNNNIYFQSQILETKNMIDEERIEISENQLKEAKQMVEESDIKYDEVRIKDDIWYRICLHSMIVEQKFTTLPTRQVPLKMVVKQKFTFCMMCLD